MDIVTAGLEPSTRKRKTAWKRGLLFGISLILAAFAAYNMLLSFFPVQVSLSPDEAEHLHVSYLLGSGERPFIDFIENHPALFNSFLRWLKGVSHAQTVRQWALLARAVIFLHFILALAVLCFWLARFLKVKLSSVTTWPSFLLAFSCLGFYNEQAKLIWQIRPDWICYAYTLIGLYFFVDYLVAIIADQPRRFRRYGFIAGAILIGAGNALIPKGPIILLGFLAGIATLIVVRAITIPPGFPYKKVGVAILIFSLIAGAALFMLVLLDCHLGGITLGQWAKGVLALNSTKHLPFTGEEINPISTILALFSHNLLTGLIFIMWIAWEFALGISGKDRGLLNMVVIATLALCVNLIIAPFGNGLTWSYYFMPTLFSAFILYVALAQRVLSLREVLRTSRPQGYSLAFLALLGLCLCTLLGKQVIELYPRVQERAALAQDLRVSRYDDYVLEATLPHNLIYLARHPVEMPVVARQWDYYFFLAEYKGMWADVVRLGLGPDFRQRWRAKFMISPPDAITLPGQAGLWEFAAFLHKQQGMASEWLVEEIARSFCPMMQWGRKIFVRNDRIELFRELGWKPISPPSADGSLGIPEKE